MNVEKAAYTSNHDDADLKLVKEEDRVPMYELMLKISMGGKEID